jgi:MFS transporter, MHS family, shikimate and dehydroshikimate transport protein
LASPLAGGVAPLVSIALLRWSGGRPWPIALYLIALSAITLVSVWLASETHKSQLGEDDAAL